MCGIAGIVDPRKSVDVDVLERAIALLERRGPDDAGAWVGSGAGFGHRRLAVIDLTASARQPMTSSDGRYVIVFNGEIYNFVELKRSLQNDYGEWRSHSDTEVILAAYRRWGSDCVSRLRGMFAFAIWDQRARCLFAARDRMGVKPFYYHWAAGKLAFASRPDALLALCPSLSPTVDPQALRFYLEGGFVPCPHSIFQQVQKLPPGHWLMLRDGRLQTEQYWNLTVIPPDKGWRDRPEEELVSELETRIETSVRLRMVSDVPLGAFLSGGVDSSLVVAMMAKLSTQRVKTFSIGFQEPDFDESRYAALVADHLGTDHHHEILRIDDLLDLLPLFQEQYDEPFFDSSAFPTMAVSRLARRHVTVVLTGDGGDELFGGYHYYRIAQHLAPFFRLPGAMRRGLATVLGVVPVHRFKLLAGALRQADAVSAYAFSRSIAKDFGDVLHRDAICDTFSMGEMYGRAQRNFAAGLEPGETGMRLDATHVLSEEYLQKVDVASMAFSLEAREPLLDHELVEWAMRLPLEWKLRRGVGKYLLRRLAERYVPASVLDRPKRGFEVPIGAWLRGPLRGWAEERINDPGIYTTLPLDRQKVNDLFRLHLSGQRNVHPLLWAILMLFDYFARPRGKLADQGQDRKIKYDA